MAKTQINTKSSSYMRDKEAFMKELRQFNESKNNTLKPPIVNGIEIDLYLFYSLVIQRGGIGKVNQTDVWETFLRPLRLPHPSSGEALRTSTQRPTATHAERLALSLISPMPNEQDFAVNVLRDTIGRSYFEARGRYPDDFWKMRAGGGGARELADETKFTQSVDGEQPELMVQAMAAHNNLTDCLNMERGDDDLEKIASDLDVLEDWVTEPSEESQLFAPSLAGGASCVYTQRVLQIASIVRSLSFHEENIQYLSKNTTLIRFLLLCANCWVGTLRQSGLDTLGNVSTELIIKEPATCLISRHIISTIQSALVSPDRARVYSDVCALLTLRDIMVLVCTLECVYALTSLGDRASESVARVPGLVHTLVSLVTVESPRHNGAGVHVGVRVRADVTGRPRRGPAALAAVAEREPPQPPQPTQPPQPQNGVWRNSGAEPSDFGLGRNAASRTTTTEPAAREISEHSRCTAAYSVSKEEPVQIQIDEQTQLTIKSNQNKMLADLLEKKSNPPVQVVQMTPQMGAPTIQITETGQIVQVKQESPMIQISEGGLVAGGQFFQIKNDQGSNHPAQKRSVTATISIQERTDPERSYETGANSSADSRGGSNQD
ncbi:Uncharacterized protein OBRU01_00983 [Operophtera brumata]|uniref:ARID domain-containing protein n=1 Tax=Operophtera brumata TaxID=104452 RepID=A0A0L7LTF8_OPEBR|nr:Uncharacterized protein OBRU01_00983 [Operophtera brumata]